MYTLITESQMVRRRKEIRMEKPSLNEIDDFDTMKK